MVEPLHDDNNIKDSSSILNVAVIGSSGGGIATLGHTDPQSLLRCIDQQLSHMNGRIVHALYVNMDNGISLDAPNLDHDRASLYQVRMNRSNRTSNQHEATVPQREPLDCQITKQGTLRQVNECCQQQQKIIAQEIFNGTIHALICISCHVAIFGDTLNAASHTRIPVTGSGGTSLSQAVSQYQLQLVGNAGGSVATTSYTRAISYTHAISTHYHRNYQPWKNPSPTTTTRPSWTSILNACLPSFWSVCLLKFGLTFIQEYYRRDYVAHATFGPTLQLAIHFLEDLAVPAACSVTMATSLSTTWTSTATSSNSSQSSVVMAAVVASSTCSRSVLSGLLAGYLVALGSMRLPYLCICCNVPATMTTLLNGGGIGAIVALLMLLIAPLLAQLSHHIRWIVQMSVSMQDARFRMLSGATWGALSCYGSKVGYYHAIHLPLILMEMELGTPSFLGAVDELTLVLVCAGIGFGNLVAHVMFASLHEADVALCRRGLRINLCYGDFVECCYPCVESHPLINVGGYLGSAISSAWLVRHVSSIDQIPQSLAYLPWPVSVLLAGKQASCFVVASAHAAGVPFLATIVALAWERFSGRGKFRSRRKAN